MATVTECTRRPILTPCRLTDFDYQIDPYVGCGHLCRYCYVLEQAETDWSREIRIHGDVVGQLEHETETIAPQTIYLGYHTDPYQPCEEEYRQTRKVLSLLEAKGFSASILTKSDLVCRDIDLLQGMNDAAVSVSVAFNDDLTRRRFEDNTRDTGKRIEALGRLKEAGIRTGALVCPVIPTITDANRLIEWLQPYTDVIWVYGLSIRDPGAKSWRNMRSILAAHYPDRKNRIEAAVFDKDHPDWEELRAQLHTLKNDRQLDLNIHV
jgi:DNA repair photolyase